MRTSSKLPVFLIASACTLAGCGGAGTEIGSGEPPKGATLERNCAASLDERLHAMSDEGIGLASALGLPSGRYALPAASEPTQLVVMFHGNHNDSCSWRDHLRNVAAKGAVAVAMDYTGQTTETGPDGKPIENYGWFVSAGAADSIEAARHFLGKYPSITTVFAFGVSMGGNASGMAVASEEALRPDGGKLFDYWIDIEGVNNLTEEYFILRAAAQGVPAAAVAQAEIEAEAGGAFEDVPENYAALTNLYRVPDMAYLKGVVVVHGLDDGLVSTTQSPELAAALNAAQVPTHLYTVLLKGEGESGGTLSGMILGDVAGLPYESPFAGHGWEGSQTQLVMRTGLDALYALMDGGQVTPGETPVPGN